MRLDVSAALDMTVLRTFGDGKNSDFQADFNRGSVYICLNCSKECMRKFDISFRNDLRKKVESIESASGAELVVAILPRTSHYLEYYFGVGIALGVVVLTTLMFIPTEIWYVYIFFETIGVGLFGAGMLWLVRPLLRKLVGNKELVRRTDRHASAIFHKAKIHETRQRVGILLVFFWLERIVVMIPDRGVSALVPPDELALLQAQCQKVFVADDPAGAVLDALNTGKEIFAKYIPVDTHPINELPDELWIE
jgi:putative membrane protein